MDMLSWILLFWIAVASVVFFGIQKLQENNPNLTFADAALTLGQRVSSTVTDAYSAAKTAAEQRKSSRIENGPTSAAPIESQPSSSVYNYSPSYSPTSSAASTQNYTLPKQQSVNTEWLNQTIQWLFRYYRGSPPEFVHAWLRSLNEAAKKAANAIGCEVVFEDVGVEDASAPRFDNVRSELGPRDHLTLRALMECPVVTLRLVSSQQLPDRLLVTNYDARILRLRGEMQARIACIANELFLMACFDGRPTLELELYSHDQTQEGESVDPVLVDEAIRKSLMSAVTNLSLTACRDFPQPVEEVFKKLNTSGSMLPSLNTSPQRNSPAGSGPVAERLVHQESALGYVSSAENRLLVKIIRAQKLGAGEAVSQPFVVVELDEPAQKHTTTLGLNISPYWDEHFLFEVNRTSEEMLFEIYDKIKTADDPKFLGLAIVNLEEARRAVSHVQVLTLQSRPYTNDAVSGTLTVEFLFMDSVDVGKHVDVYREPLSGGGDGTMTTSVVTARRPLTGHQQFGGAAGDMVVTPTKSTSVMVKSVSQYFQTPASLEAESPSVDHRDNKTAPPGLTSYTGRPSLQNPNITVTAPMEDSSKDRGRTRNKRGSTGSGFFGGLKERLSFRKTAPKRTGSLDAGVSESTYHPPRSISTPPSRDNSATRQMDANRERRERGGYESDGDASSADSVLFQSTLVLEVMENGVLKHYLVPPNAVMSPGVRRMLKRGRKLHIYNEHTFLAIRLPSVQPCEVCGKNITRGFGKQAYRCRDCQTLAHKRCHYKIETRCPCSTVPALEMEYLVTK